MLVHYFSTIRQCLPGSVGTGYLLGIIYCNRTASNNNAKNESNFSNTSFHCCYHFVVALFNLLVFNLVRSICFYMLIRVFGVTVVAVHKQMVFTITSVLSVSIPCLLAFQKLRCFIGQDKIMVIVELN